MDAIQYVNDQLKVSSTEFPNFNYGDNVVVSYRIVEGDKQRIQDFKGDVIKINGEGGTRTFTVRKVSFGVGVERIFPYSSPNIVGVKVLKRGKVRRAKLYYLRQSIGKKSRIKERER